MHTQLQIKDGMKPPKVKRTSAEVLEQLTEQVEILMSHCAQFDVGKEIMAKPMATTLRVLLHSGRPGGNTVALLHQAHLREGWWLDVAGTLSGVKESGSNLIQITATAVIGGGAGTAKCLPRFARYYYSDSNAQTPSSQFGEWWTNTVAVNVETGKKFSRMDIVRMVADTDGGAHVDPSLDQSYLDLISGELIGTRAHLAPNSLGFSHGPGTGGVLIPSAHLASVRTIAHETLMTLQRSSPGSFKEKYDPKAPEAA